MPYRVKSARGRCPRGLAELANRALVLVVIGHFDSGHTTVDQVRKWLLRLLPQVCARRREASTWVLAHVFDELVFQFGIEIRN